MTNTDIIEMAREAGFETLICEDCIFTDDRDGDCTEELKRFAALVAAAEREACAKVCEGWDFVNAIRARGETK